MSNWDRIASDAAESAFGAGARIRIQRIEHGSSWRAVVWIEDGIGKVLGIAGGANSAEAFRALIQMCYRDDHRPTTQEVAAVLDVDDSRVRQLALAGRLLPAEPGHEGKPARFDPAAVAGRLERMKTQNLTPNL